MRSLSLVILLALSAASCGSSGTTEATAAKPAATVAEAAPLDEPGNEAETEEAVATTQAEQTTTTTTKAETTTTVAEVLAYPTGDEICETVLGSIELVVGADRSQTRTEMKTDSPGSAVACSVAFADAAGTYVASMGVGLLYPGDDGGCAVANTAAECYEIPKRFMETRDLLSSESRDGLGDQNLVTVWDFPPRTVGIAMQDGENTWWITATDIDVENVVQIAHSLTSS